MCAGYLFLLPGLLRTNHSILFCPRCNGVRRRGLSLLCTCPVRDGWGSTARRPRSMTGACTGGDLVRERAHVRGLAGSRPARLVVLVTIDVVRDTPSDCHFSAWSRPKPAPDPLPGPSVASGVIPTKGARNEVLQPPAGRAPQGRWRSSPWKRCNHAPPRSRVREHPAPLGALRPSASTAEVSSWSSQGAPRTARCIKTLLLGGEVIDVPGQGAPRTARCIKTVWHGSWMPAHVSQGAPRTARCIKTPGQQARKQRTRRVREHPAPLGALRRASGHEQPTVVGVRGHSAPL